MKFASGVRLSVVCLRGVLARCSGGVRRGVFSLMLSVCCLALVPSAPLSSVLSDLSPLELLSSALLSFPLASARVLSSPFVPSRLALSWLLSFCLFSSSLLSSLLSARPSSGLVSSRGVSSRFVLLCLGLCSTSPPGGNQVDGLPPVRNIRVFLFYSKRTLDDEVNFGVEKLKFRNDSKCI